MSGQVQETNDFSIASKYSMVHKGYFKDEYMQYLSPKLKRRSPLINIGYYVRAVVVNDGVQLFLNVMSKTECQFVSLGAGFDTTFFRLVHERANIKYFEVDLREVVDRKINYIKNSEFLFNKLVTPQENDYGLTSKHYSIICKDLSHISELQSALIGCGFDMKKPTLFLSECAITYMSEESSTNLISWASEMDDVLFMVYEQINPDDGFGCVMMNHFNTIDSPLRSVQVYKTKEDQINRYKLCGCTGSFSAGAFEIYWNKLTQEQHERILNLEPFDEWEEWHLTSSHYTLSVGAKGLFLKPISEYFLSFPTVSDLDLSEPSFTWNILENTQLKLYAHSSVLIWNSEAILTIGGYGLSEDRQHKRIDRLHLLYLKNKKIIKITPQKFAGITWDCMYHTCTLLSDSDSEATLLFYGGRTSPVNHVNSPGFIMTIRKEENPDGVEISVRKVAGDGSCPEARRRHVAVPLSCGKIFISGGLSAGHNSTLKVFGDSWLFSCEESWVRLESSLPPRFSHSAVFHDGSVFIAGGIGEEFSPLDDVWSFEVSSNSWTQYNFNILPRYSHTTHYYKDSIILIGGVNYLSEKQPGICIINLKDGSVKEYKLPVSNKKFPVMVHNHSSILSGSDEIYIIGGGGNCFSFGTAFNEQILSFRLASLLQNR